VRSPLAKLVAVCLLVLAMVQPRSPDTPPVISPSATPQADWTPLRILLDEQAYREAVFYAAAEQAKQQQQRPASRFVSGGSHRGYATAKECVSMVEHGGSYDRSNNPSHKGRYQFGRPAWISFGGIPEHWDNWDLATPDEQDSVFEAAWSQGLAVQQQQWLRWDGC
jgi:hypothetical protein